MTNSSSMGAFGSSGECQTALRLSDVDLCPSTGRYLGLWISMNTYNLLDTQSKSEVNLVWMIRESEEVENRVRQAVFKTKLRAKRLSFLPHFGG